jgi:2-dehydro-3-deoxy-D-arabinonate dehydratase
MRLAKVALVDGEKHIAQVNEDSVKLLDLTQVENCNTLSDILHHADPVGLVHFLATPDTATVPFHEVVFLAPIDQQEIWAAGVTYKRSQVARMEESESAASHYDKVYTAERPELFSKGGARRASGPGEPVRVRYDSQWSVPEPEFTLVISPAGKLVAYTIGNDMSARDIEGENPLYLPQAKVYNQCTGLGPCVLVANVPLSLESTEIKLNIERGGATVFAGDTNLGQLNRTFEDLIGWLYREQDFPDGTFLLTGTGIVPPDEFTLENGDTVHITVTGIGTLTNPVVKDA